MITVFGYSVLISVMFTVTEFSKWKGDVEDRTVTRYVKKRKDTTNSKGDTRRSFYCHRSGSFLSRGRGKRHLKMQGTSKIGSKCPASMHVKISVSGELYVISSLPSSSMD